MCSLPTRSFSFLCHTSVIWQQVGLERWARSLSWSRLWAASPQLVGAAVAQSHQFLCCLWKLPTLPYRGSLDLPCFEWRYESVICTQKMKLIVAGIKRNANWIFALYTPRWRARFFTHSSYSPLTWYLHGMSSGSGPCWCQWVLSGRTDVSAHMKQSALD